MKKTFLILSILFLFFILFNNSKGNGYQIVYSLTCPSDDAVPCCNNGYLPNVSQFSLCCINAQGQMTEIVISGDCCKHLWYVNGGNPPSPYAPCYECRD